MPGVRGLQKRMRRLEQATSPRSPIEAAYGSLESFLVASQAEIGTGRFCTVDGPIILNCIRRWHDKNLWGGWRRQRNQMWEYDGR